jgi:hypothetical protein
VTVIGTHVAKQTLPAISQQIKTNTSIDFLPIQKIQKSEVDAQGVTNQMEYKIPLKAKNSGKIDFPILMIQYFDTDTGRLKRVKTSIPWVIAYNRWLQFFITFIGFILLMLISISLISKIKLYRKRSILKNQALKQLEEAKNHQQILTALQQLSISQGWNKPLTLREFITIWNKSLNIPPNSKEAPDSLSDTIYQVEEDIFSLHPLNMVQSSLTALTIRIRQRL